MKHIVSVSKFALLLAIVLVSTRFVEPAVAEPEAVEAQFKVAWDSNSELFLTNAANSANGARLPELATAPNGTRLMVTFNHQQSAASNNNDPYYVVSGNNGTTWSTPAPIFTSNGVNSIQPSVSFDSSNKAHAVWVEDEKNLYYAPEASWPNTFKLISGPATILIDSPKVFATSSQIIDVVWIEGNTSGFGLLNVFHARTFDGGNSWGAVQTEFTTAAESRSPDILVEGSKIHLVWEEEFTASRRLVKYVVSNDGGISFSSPITISDSTSARSAERPSIVRKNGVLEVIYSNKGTSGLTDQFISHITCAANCELAANWSDSVDASGFAVGANANNSEVIISSLTSLGDCSIVSFHGTVDGLPDNNEIVFNTTSCEAGKWTFALEATPSNVRSLRPTLGVQGNYIYMAYTQATDGFSTKDQIRFIRGELAKDTSSDGPPTIYLPTIFR